MHIQSLRYFICSNVRQLRKFQARRSNFDILQIRLFHGTLTKNTEDALACKGCKKSTAPSCTCTIVGADAADTLMKHLLPDLRSGDTIVQMNPGPGVLTQKIKDLAPNHRLVLYEPRDNYREQLEMLPQNDKIVISSMDLSKFYYYYVNNKWNDSSTFLEDFLDLLPDQSDPEQSNVRIVAAVNHDKFFSQLIYAIALSESFFQTKYPTFYIYMPSNLYHRYFSSFPITSKLAFKYSTIFQFFFKTTKLDEGNRSEFTPRLTKAKSGNHDTSIYHLVKIEPCWTILYQFQGEERQAFYYFLFLLGRRVSTETLMDIVDRFDNNDGSIGAHLIDVGFQVYTYSQNLSREEILFIYQILISHPNFTWPVFEQAVKRKMDTVTGVVTQDYEEQMEKEKEEEEEEETI